MIKSFQKGDSDCIIDSLKKNWILSVRNKLKIILKSAYKERYFKKNKKG